MDAGPRQRRWKRPIEIVVGQPQFVETRHRTEPIWYGPFNVSIASIEDSQTLGLAQPIWDRPRRQIGVLTEAHSLQTRQIGEEILVDGGEIVAVEVDILKKLEVSERGQGTRERVRLKRQGHELRELVEIGRESAGETLGSHVDGGDVAVAIAGIAAVDAFPAAEIAAGPAGGGGAEALAEVVHDGGVVGEGGREERE